MLSSLIWPATYGHSPVLAVLVCIVARTFLRWRTGTGGGNRGRWYWCGLLFTDWFSFPSATCGRSLVGAWIVLVVPHPDMVALGGKRRANVSDGIVVVVIVLLLGFLGFASLGAIRCVRRARPFRFRNILRWYAGSSGGQTLAMELIMLVFTAGPLASCRLACFTCCRRALPPRRRKTIRRFAASSGGQAWVTVLFWFVFYRWVPWHLATWGPSLVVAAFVRLDFAIPFGGTRGQAARRRGRWWFFWCRRTVGVPLPPATWGNSPVLAVASRIGVAIPFAFSWGTPRANVGDGIVFGFAFLMGFRDFSRGVLPCGRLARPYCFRNSPRGYAGASGGQTRTMVLFPLVLYVWAPLVSRLLGCFTCRRVARPYCFRDALRGHSGTSGGQTRAMVLLLLLL